MKRAALALLLLAGCHAPPAEQESATPGDRIEAAAEAAGLVIDPASKSLIGSWARDTDRACVVPSAKDGGASRIGVLIDYGDGQGCAASGTVKRSGDRLDVRLGACRLTANFDGERITFPAAMPAACESLCTGRASLAAMSVERLSESQSEAAMLRAPNGRALCGG